MPFVSACVVFTCCAPNHSIAFCFAPPPPAAATVAVCVLKTKVWHYKGNSNPSREMLQPRRWVRVFLSHSSPMFCGSGSLSDCFSQLPIVFFKRRFLSPFYVLQCIVWPLCCFENYETCSRLRSAFSVACFLLLAQRGKQKKMLVAI